MPRYQFTIQDDQSYSASEGAELPTGDAAADEALQIARELSDCEEFRWKMFAVATPERDRQVADVPPGPLH